MNESSPRVALLARAGGARDCVRSALLAIGVEVVVEEDPSTVEPRAVLHAGPQVVMVLLDAVSEDALGRLDEVLGDPSVEVMFEEADVALAREGWEEARWRRHLSAKLHRRADALPPTAGEVPAVDALSVQLEELIDTDGGLPPVRPGTGTTQSDAGSDFSVFDPVGAEAADDGADEFVLTVNGFELDGGDLVLPTVIGPDFSASDFDPLLAELDAELPEPAPRPATEWQGGLVEDFGSLAMPVDDDSFGAASAPIPTPTPTPGEPARMSFGELSLVDDASPMTIGSSQSARLTPDLDDLERRISTLQLVDDEAAIPPVPAFAPAPAAKTLADGAVLVLAGIGGPDAVRQLLGGLPASFAGAVLVRQRLDGARYDKLVAQMQRATSLSVALAEPGQGVTPGTVYVLGDGVGLDAAGGLRFTASSTGTLIQSLPAERSAVIVLSGADTADVTGLASLQARGAFIGAQAEEGCYDDAAARLATQQGATRAPPSELARHLAERWSS